MLFDHTTGKIFDETRVQMTTVRDVDPATILISIDAGLMAEIEFMLTNEGREAILKRLEEGSMFGGNLYHVIKDAGSAFHGKADMIVSKALARQKLRSLGCLGRRYDGDASFTVPVASVDTGAWGLGRVGVSLTVDGTSVTLNVTEKTEELAARAEAMLATMGDRRESRSREADEADLRRFIQQCRGEVPFCWIHSDETAITDGYVVVKEAGGEPVVIDFTKDGIPFSPATKAAVQAAALGMVRGPPSRHRAVNSFTDACMYLRLAERYAVVGE